jgi:hypothetical protein
MFVDVITWLCQSPRRLAIGAVTVLTVLLVGGSALFGHGGGASGTASGSRSTATSTTAAAQVPDAAPYVTAAVAFVRVWAQLKPGETPDQWRASLVPLTTPDLSLALRTTDPTRLPGVPPSGEPVVRFLTQTSALIAVSLSDGSSVLVTLVTGDTRPLVSDIQPNAGD